MLERRFRYNKYRTCCQVCNLHSTSFGSSQSKVLILNAIADEIDNFANDFKGTGFHILEVVPTGFEIIPTDPNGDLIKILYTSDQINELYARENQMMLRTCS